MRPCLLINLFITATISISCSSINKSYENVTKHLMFEVTNGLKNIAALSLKTLPSCLSDQMSGQLYFQIVFKRSSWRHQLIIEEVKFYQDPSYAQVINRKCQDSVIRSLEKKINEAASFNKNGFEMYIKGVEFLNLYGHLYTPYQIKFIIGSTKEEVKFRDDEVLAFQ